MDHGHRKIRKKKRNGSYDLLPFQIFETGRSPCKMESREDGGGTSPIVAHTPKKEFTSITAAIRDGHSMAGTASANGESLIKSLVNDDGSTKENLQYPASGELAKMILSNADDLVVGPPDAPLNEEELEDDQLTHRRRRETTSTDSDNDSDVDPVPREWKELSRADGTGRFAETVALRKSDEEVAEGINELERGQKDVFSNIGRWGVPPEVAQG